VVSGLEEAGLTAVPYHVDVPSFGDWGFVLASRGPAPPALDISQGAPELRFLTPAVLDASRVFAPDRIPDEGGGLHPPRPGHPRLPAPGVGRLVTPLVGERLKFAARSADDSWRTGSCEVIAEHAAGEHRR
jgi:hypothetical protein